MFIVANSVRVPTQSATIHSTLYKHNKLQHYDMNVSVFGSLLLGFTRCPRPGLFSRRLLFFWRRERLVGDQLQLLLLPNRFRVLLVFKLLHFIWNLNYT